MYRSPGRRFRPRLLPLLVGLACAGLLILGGPTTLAADLATDPAGGKDDGREPIVLRDVRWQILPEGVRDVVVGPDDRAWFLFWDSGYRPRFDVAAVKRRIEREFAKPGPQLVSAEPVLFEPGGRVWFRTRAADGGVGPEQLLGYDGNAWVEREAPEGLSFDGECPGHAPWPLRHENVYCNGRAFFTCWGTVHCFDGRQWSTREFFATPTPQWHASIRLLAEPDGKGVVAVAEGVGEPRWTLARWRDGKWAELAKPPGTTYADVRAAAAAPDGVWLLFREKGLAFVAYGDEARPLDELIAGLGDKDFHVRDAMERQLQARVDEPYNGDKSDAELRAALAAADDAEVRARLQKVLRSAEQARQEVESGRRPKYPAPPPVQFGAYVMPDPRPGFLLSDRRGNLFIEGSFARIGRPAADGDKGNQEAGRQGILMVGPHGFVRLFDDSALVRRWRGMGETRGPLFFGDGKAWLPGETSTDRAGLLDVPSGKVMAEVPDRNFHELLAVRSDGTLFVEAGPMDSGLIMVCNPHAPDNLLPLRPAEGVKPPDLAEPLAYAFADDGSVWAEDRAIGIVRFAGKAWEPVAELAGARRAAKILPGRNGACLVRVWGERNPDHPDEREAGPNGKWFLAAPAGKDTADPASRADSDDLLEDLILRHRDAVVAAFGGPGLGMEPVGVRADNAGNIWVVRSRRVRGEKQFKLEVLIGQTWLDATDAARAVGVGTVSCELMAFVGDGAGGRAGAADSAIYLCGWNGAAGGDHEGSGAALARVVDGRPAFTPAPTFNRLGRPVYDADGALWLPGILHKPPAQAQEPRRPAGPAPATRRVVPFSPPLAVAARLGPSGVTAQVDEAHPLLFDQGGNLWLRAEPFQFNPNEVFHVWRDGKVVGDPPLEHPGVHRPLFCDRPGSVYAFTAAGVRHLTEDPGHPGQFRAAELYTLSDFEGDVTDVGLASSFFAVLTGVSRDGKPAHELQLLPVPGR